MIVSVMADMDLVKDRERSKEFMHRTKRRTKRHTSVRSQLKPSTLPPSELLKKERVDDAK